MLVEPERMLLDVDGNELSIAFDHTLSDSEDAHRTWWRCCAPCPNRGTLTKPSAAGHRLGASAGSPSGGCRQRRTPPVA